MPVPLERRPVGDDDDIDLTFAGLSEINRGSIHRSRSPAITDTRMECFKFLNFIAIARRDKERSIQPTCDDAKDTVIAGRPTIRQPKREPLCQLIECRSIHEQTKPVYSGVRWITPRSPSAPVTLRIIPRSSWGFCNDDG